MEVYSGYVGKEQLWEELCCQARLLLEQENAGMTRFSCSILAPGSYPITLFNDGGIIIIRG